jgi:hypothetical protein
MMNIVALVEYFFAHPIVVVLLNCISLIVKIAILLTLYQRIKKISPQHNFAPYHLIGILLGSSATDVAWILSHGLKALSMNLSHHWLSIFCIRIAWILSVLQYQSLTLFIETLINRQYLLPLRQQFFILCNIVLASCFLYVTIFNFNCSTAQDRFMFEMYLQKVAVIFLRFVIMLPTLYNVFYAMHGADCIPVLLKKQLYLFVYYLVVPQLILDIIEHMPLNISVIFVTNSYTISALSTIFMTSALVFCAKNIMRLRFLNFSQHVQTLPNMEVIAYFTRAIDSMSQVIRLDELFDIVHTFFQTTFGLSFTKIHVHFLPGEDSLHAEAAALTSSSNRDHYIAGFLATHYKEFMTLFHNDQVLVYDEIDFTNFYEPHNHYTLALQFLRAIDAYIFLPLLHKGALVGYITIARYAQDDKLYGKADYDAMTLFGGYLASIINLLENQNVEHLFEVQHRLIKELHEKHQEIEQCKEGIRILLNGERSAVADILFYDHRQQFLTAHKTPLKIVPVSVFHNKDHCLAIAFIDIAKKVVEYTTPFSSMIQDENGKNVCVHAFLDLSEKSVTLLVGHPSFMQELQPHIHMLQDPNDLDYLFYLQTTSAGHRINSLIPGTTKELIQFKIQLLKCGLSNAPILLTCNPDDSMTTIELLHHISMRNTLQTVNVYPHSDMFDIRTALFGINKFMHVRDRACQKPILQELDGIGTLHIGGIEFLSHEVQDLIAQYLRLSYFHPYKSEQKITSNVRIIFSSNKHYIDLVRHNLVSGSLRTLLQHSTLALPPIALFSDTELFELADTISKQISSGSSHLPLLSLNTKEKKKLIAKRPTSIHGFKNQITKALEEKAEAHKHPDTPSEEVCLAFDPDILAIMHSPKQTLNDPQKMSILWKKFDKNQSKIAEFLGVHRSTVNRRCREHNLR